MAQLVRQGDAGGPGSILEAGLSFYGFSPVLNMTDKTLTDDDPDSFSVSKEK